MFRNQFFLFPYKDILGVVKVCLDIRPTADKMHRQIEFIQFRGLLTQLSILFGNTFFHTCTCRGAGVFSHQQFAHKFLLGIAQKFPHPHVERVYKCAHALKVCSTGIQTGKYFSIANSKEFLLQVNNYEIVVNFFHISHNLT